MEIEICPDAEIMENVAKYIAADASPDLVDMRDNTFPYYIAKNSYEPLDQYFDLSAPQWEGVADIIDGYAVNGKHYYYPWCYYVAPCVMIYNRGLFNEYGINDPKELYDEGNWTWDTFLDMADKFQQSGENKFIIDGWSVSEKLLATTGTPLVSIEDGKLVSNLSTPAVERGMALAETLCSQNYRYPRHELNNWSINYVAWANGDTLFMDEGTYFWEERGCKYAKRFEWDEGDVFFVPAPRDPSSDTYYQSMKQDAIMWCAGSTNKAGFQAWIACNLAATKDADVVAAAREKSKRDYNWTDEMTS